MEEVALAGWGRQSIFAVMGALGAPAGFAALAGTLIVQSRRLACQKAQLAQTAEQFRNSEARFRDFALTSADWFWESDADHRMTYVSSGIRAFNQDPTTRIGRIRMEFASDIGDEPEKWAEHIATLNRHEPFRDFVYKRKVGIQPENTVTISGNPVLGSTGEFLGYRGTARDITRRIRNEGNLQAMALQMTHSAEHDALTDLPNRALLSDLTNQAIALARRHKRSVAILSLDLDGFKHINDALGHSLGDQLLQSTAKRLVDCVRDSDTVSRQGGDEFVILLAEVEQWQDVATTTKRILQAVAEPHSISQHDLHITTSIGVSLYPGDGLNAEMLIKNADISMYQAKQAGRDTYRFFKHTMNAQAVERQSLEEGLRRALERHELTLHYQPKINLRTGKITGAEALLRWTHPTRGPISPAEFIPIAEDCGLILPIGAWVLRQACEQTRNWIKEGLPLITMAVNVSGLQFRDEHFLENLFSMLGEIGLDPSAVELEVTESVLMKNADSAASILRVVRERGMRVAIDDFGTGYSSLSYLHRFPLDTLKVDQAFVRQISTADDDTAIVTAIVAMARSLNLRVVAEGVETKEELAFLRALQCDEAQGYYFSRPAPAQQFASLLAAGIPGSHASSHSGAAAEHEAGKGLGWTNMHPVFLSNTPNSVREHEHEV